MRTKTYRQLIILLFLMSIALSGLIKSSQAQGELDVFEWGVFYHPLPICSIGI